MTKNEVYPSTYVKAADLSPEGENLTIAKVTIEEVGEERERKPVIQFNELEKSSVVNVTNWNSIVDITGAEDSDDWLGCRIKLYRAKVPFGGKTVEAVRVEVADEVKPARGSPLNAQRVGKQQDGEDGGGFDPY